MEGAFAPMNQKELNELRRRFRLDRSGISRVYGCYVNSAGEIVSRIDVSLGLMPQEEQEMYLKLLKKSLTGTLGKNLIDIEFSTQQVMEGEEHRLLQKLRSEIEDEEAREALYQRILEHIDMGDSSYLILLAADAYDVPYRGRDDELQDDVSDQVFRYLVCSICPIKSPTLALRYFHEENQFHGCSTGDVVSAPEVGFLFPAFDDRTANLYNALFYSKNPAQIHQEVIDGVFCVEPPMSAPEQKDVFDNTLSDTLGSACSYDVVQAVHEQIRERILEHKESKDPEPLDLSVSEVGAMLLDSGVPDQQVEEFRQECRRQYGEDVPLVPANIIDSKKFEICTPEVKISVSPEHSYLIETRIIDGRKYLLVPADGVVEVNGIGVTISEEQLPAECPVG